MSIPANINPFLLAAAAVASPVQIERSLRFNSSDSAYLSKAFGSPTSSVAWTWASWVKKTLITTSTDYRGIFECGAGSNYAYLDFSDNSIRYVNRPTTGTIAVLQTTPVYRDASAWFHVVFAYDSANGTSTDRLRLYVNGTRVTIFSSSTYPDPSQASVFNSAVDHRIGRDAGNNGYFDGYLADIHFIDGQALTPSSFTEVSATTGQLIPKAYTGSFGTNGFWLKFSDNSNNTAATLGKDYSGNSNNWTPNNLSVTAGAGNDSLVDTPTSYGTDDGLGGSVRGNYATLNPLTSSGGTYSQGNLRFVGPTDWRRSNGTIAVSTGKWYWEVTLANGPYSPRTSSSPWNAFGFGLSSVSHSTTPSSAVTDAVVLKDNGYFNNFSSSVTDVGTAFSSGDVLSCAVDLDANTFTFRLNNTQVATGTIGGTAGRELVPIIISYNDQYGVMDCNFGQRPFAYTAPSGFKALCDTNLPAPVVAKGSSVMDVKLYTGNGSTQTISGLGFSPDLVWIKARSTSSYNHFLLDTIRGVNNELNSNTTDFEYTRPAPGSLTAFNSDGFNLNTAIGVNASSTTYAAWCWDAGTSTVTNTQGSITSQVRANVSAGFSVVTWTSPSSGDYTIGHGLGVAPSLVITKSRSASGDQWYTFHRSVCTSTSNYLKLSSTDGLSTYAGAWGATLPTGTVVGLNAGGGFIPSSATAVAYCFAPVSGYSSFGSYTGNGSSDGPFVYTGFRPAFVMMKMSSSSSHWWINDNKRTGSYNVADGLLFPNLSSAESTFATMDLLSNGFKVRAASSDINTSSAAYIYAAFAESPFQFSRAR